MTGKSVHRLRVQAFKSRIRPQTGKASGVVRASVTRTAVEQEAATNTSKDGAKGDSDEVSDRAHPAQSKSKSVNQRLRARTPNRLFAKVGQGLRGLAAPLVWLCLLAFCGGTGIAAFLWLTTLPPVPSCQKLQPGAADTDRLYCAEQAARSGKVETLLAGLALVKNWSADHPLHSRANRAVQEWSKALLTIAQTKADQGDLAGAIALAKKIPSSSPIHSEVQAALLGWQRDQHRGQTIDNAIQTALKQQDWQTAAAQIQTLSSVDDQYARQNLSRLRQQLVTERAARQQLQQARQVAESAPDNTATIGRAIALAEQIRPGSYAHADALVDVQTWGQQLLNRLTEQLGQADTAGAIATAQVLPLSLPLPSVARDLVWIGRAQPLATLKTSASPYTQWQLWVALAQMRQIQANSPLYPQAQRLIPQLEYQSQDLLQIQLATATANWQQIPTLQAAIGLIQTVAPGHPQRIYAQTLIAQWRKEIERLEDRPYLVKAQQLAAAGGIWQLKAAITQAQQIAPKRALRLDAQSAIAKWTRQIQTIEDQPILNQAQTLAKQGRLKDAIQTASNIRAGRALYADAQAAINQWNAQIQIAEDQPILDEASALADRGRFTRAINTASRISSARALYGEAQSAIARWSVQRDAVLRARRSGPYERSRRESYNSPPSTPYAPPAAIPPSDLPPP